MPAKRWKLKSSKALAVVVALATLGPGIGSATSYKILHTFNGTDGTGPLGGVTLDDKGNLFGASASGGDLNECGGYGCGVVFELRPGADGKWAEAVLHRFDSNGNDGYAPDGGITIAAGNLYGTTSRGGQYDFGTVFEMTRGSGGWAESILYSFGTHSNDGGEPTAGVAIDATGNLYGTAGVVFELSQGSSGWAEKVLHTFCLSAPAGCPDGHEPYAPVILDTPGNLYGTTRFGGMGCVGEGCGTVYELTPVSGGGWKEIVLHRFDNNGRDGVGPGGGALAMGASGELYGTTTEGGPSWCGEVTCGTVFKLTPNADGGWKETILYDFKGGASGYWPGVGVVMDKHGSLYGTAALGGEPFCDCGVIYKLAPGPKGKWTYTVLHEFGNGDDGGVPAGNLVMDGKGNLYGGTVLGGTYGGGVIFELTP